jgi:hypothetical protein
MAPIIAVFPRERVRLLISTSAMESSSNKLKRKIANKIAYRPPISTLQALDRQEFSLCHLRWRQQSDSSRLRVHLLDSLPSKKHTLSFLFQIYFQVQPKTSPSIISVIIE